MGNMVGGDFKGFGGDKEKDIVVFAQDLDIGFVSGTDRINRAFILMIKKMAVICGSLSVV